MARRDLDDLAVAFRQVREEQIELLARFSPADWESSRLTGWGGKPLSFVVTKTFQHTYEHANTVLQIGLWWGDIDRAMRGGDEPLPAA